MQLDSKKKRTLLIIPCSLTAALVSSPSALGSSLPALAREAPQEPAALSADPGEASPFQLGGYVEAYYQWNFNDPSNGMTNARGFDNRHNTFTLSNVALDALWDDAELIGRLTLQVGHTPSTYYLAEPEQPGTDVANASGPELWKFVQQAYAGYRIEGGPTITAGLFLSPIGPEAIAVHDNWNWSRSNLFFGLPFYHTGLRVTQELGGPWAVTVATYNGWNSVVDNNREKSVSTQLTFTEAELDLSLLYFGGVERPTGAPEGRPWRNLFDLHGTWRATKHLSLLAQANAGFERNVFGTSHWAAGALYARVRVLAPLFIAARGDVFFEHAAESAAGQAAPIFWSAPWVSSGTVTADFYAHERISVRLEYRHDAAGDDMYFGGQVAGDGVAIDFVPNRRSQDSVTIGVTSWF